jgi:hypothetical protein
MAERELTGISLAHPKPLGILRFERKTEPGPRQIRAYPSVTRHGSAIE